MPKIKLNELTFDNIRQWIDNPETCELSESDKRILERWDFVYDNLKIEPPYKVVKRVMNKFGVSNKTALDDVEKAQRLWNPTLRVNSEWLETFIINDAIMQINAAKQSLDHKAWMEARNALVKIYQTIAGKQADVNPEMLGNNNYFLTVINGAYVEKIDMNKINQLPVGKRVELAESVISETSEAEVLEIMNS